MTKYALLIGINYKGTAKFLPGCMNDVLTVFKLLVSWGFQKSNITVLIDDKPNIELQGMSISKPTAYNINNSLNSFVKNLAPGDKAIIFYTGHGSRIKTVTKREESCIVPLDFKKAGVVTSETIRYYLNKIPSGVNVFCVFDCCNSGTVCDLKYHTFDTSYKKDITIKIKHFDYNDWNRRQIHHILNTEENVPGSLSIDTKANIVSLSGCWDTQVSYDLGRNGALTLALMNVINKYTVNNLKFKHLIQNVRGNIMNMRINQTPQLMFGKELSLDMKIRDFLGV